MRSRAMIFLCGLCLLAPVAPAQEKADAVGSLMPKDAIACVRLPSLDRMDALGKELLPIIKSFAGAEIADGLGKTTLSALFLDELGIDAALLDRTKPIYMGMAEQGEFGFFPAAAGAAWEGEKAFSDNIIGVLKGGIIHAGRREVIASERRGPAEFLRGDVAVHVFVGEILERHKQEFDGVFGMAKGRAAAVGAMFGPAAAVIGPMFDLVRSGILSVQSCEYAITWKGDVAESEGRIVTKDGSPMRKLLARAGAPGDTNLVGFLPRGGIMTMDFNTNADWPAKEMAEWAKNVPALGAMMGNNFAQVLGSSMTGRGAMTVNAGLGSGSASMIYELKEGTDARALFANLKMDEVNAALKGMGMSFRLDRAVAKHGETEIHRVTVDAPQLGMMAAMMQNHLAAEGRYLYSVSGLSGEMDIKDLIDRVRKGEPAEHPHAKAMARLGRKRNFGFSLNLGAFKQFAMIAMMMMPQLAQALGELPDELYMSTAVSFHEGNIHWRGDWPVKKAAMAAEAIRAAMGGGQKKKAAEDEDFD